MSPKNPPRNLAGLRESGAADGLGGRVTLPGPAKASSRATDHLPLPAEAFDEALLKSSEMQRLFSAGRLDEAFKSGREALARWHALQAPDQSCEALHIMAWACLEHEQGVEALALARHALRLARVHVLPQALIKALSVLAVLHSRLHDPAVGEQMALQALSRARDLHDRASLGLALDALLRALLEADEAQRAAHDPQSAQATTERLLRHAHQAMAQSGPVPGSFVELQLRIDAAAALAACGRVTDALPVLADCIERARQEGYGGLVLWAQLYSAQASMRAGDNKTARAAVEALAPRLSADDPPRLRMAILELRLRLCMLDGDGDAASALLERSDGLQKTMLHQRFKLRATLRRSGDDVLRVLSHLEQEWRGPESGRRADKP